MHFHRPRAHIIPLFFLLVLALVLGVSSCDKKKKGKAGSAAKATPSASAGPQLTAPCAEYATRLCDKAGAESPACQSIKSTVEILAPAACKVALKEIDYSLGRLSKQRKSCDELVTRLCAAVGPKTQSCSMVTTQTQQFPPERCAMMLSHFDEIVTDLKKMEEANQPLSPELQAKLKKGPVPSFGPENAKVTIVEFSDFQCPYCAQAATVAQQVREKYGKDVRFVFRQFPLSIHADARLAAEASLAANAQGKFWQFHDRLFKNPTDLSRAALEEHAKQVGLDLGTFKKALDDKTYAAAVDADLKLGEEVSVQGTPTLFLNGERVANAGSFEALASQIDAALKAPG